MTKEEAIKILESLPDSIVAMIHPFDINYDYKEALDMAISALKDGWIPVKTRPLTEEESEYYAEHGAYYFDSTFDCQLPEDRQEVLITTNDETVETVTFYNDGDDGSYFEYYEGEGEVLAWQPKPEPYKKGE